MAKFILTETGTSKLDRRGETGLVEVRKVGDWFTGTEALVVEVDGDERLHLHLSKGGFLVATLLSEDTHIGDRKAIIF